MPGQSEQLQPPHPKYECKPLPVQLLAKLPPEVANDPKVARILYYVTETYGHYLDAASAARQYKVTEPDVHYNLGYIHEMIWYKVLHSNDVITFIVELFEDGNGATLVNAICTVIPHDDQRASQAWFTGSYGDNGDFEKGMSGMDHAREAAISLEKKFYRWSVEQACSELLINFDDHVLKVLNAYVYKDDWESMTDTSGLPDIIKKIEKRAQEIYAKEYRDIFLAIRDHGCYKPEFSIYLVLLIRDADKLASLIRIFTFGIFRRSSRFRAGVAFNPDVLAKFYARELVVSKDRKSFADELIFYLAWIWDFNFEKSKILLAQSGILEEIIGKIACLPGVDQKEVQKICELIDQWYQEIGYSPYEPMSTEKPNQQTANGTRCLSRLDEEEGVEHLEQLWWQQFAEESLVSAPAPLQ